jgi:anion-transporting  ArsA/GET3 family ATPase
VLPLLFFFLAVNAISKNTQLQDCLRIQIRVDCLQVDEAATEKFMKSRRDDQQRALKLLRSNSAFSDLTVIEAPLLDLEVRGVPALQYFGNQVWKEGIRAPHEGVEEHDKEL